MAAVTKPGQPPQAVQPQPVGQPIAGPPPPVGYQAGYQAQPPAYGVGQTHTVVLTTPSVVVSQSFRESPVRMTCPHCGAQITTSTVYTTGTFAWVICGILILFGLWLGCCLIPFCINGCKDVVHSCPNCRHQVGKYNRM